MKQAMRAKRPPQGIPSQNPNIPAGNTLAWLDNRPLARLQGRLQTLADDRPQVTPLRNLQSLADASSRMATLMRQGSMANSALGVAQREGTDDDEEVEEKKAAPQIMKNVKRLRDKKNKSENEDSDDESAQSSEFSHGGTMTMPMAPPTVYPSSASSASPTVDDQFEVTDIRTEQRDMRKRQKMFASLSKRGWNGAMDTSRGAASSSSAAAAASSSSSLPYHRLPYLGSPIDYAASSSSAAASSSSATPYRQLSYLGSPIDYDASSSAAFSPMDSRQVSDDEEKINTSSSTRASASWGGKTFTGEVNDGTKVWRSGKTRIDADKNVEWEKGGQWNGELLYRSAAEVNQIRTERAVARHTEMTRLQNVEATRKRPGRAQTKFDEEVAAAKADRATNQDKPKLHRGTTYDEISKAQKGTKNSFEEQFADQKKNTISEKKRTELIALAQSLKEDKIQFKSGFTALRASAWLQSSGDANESKRLPEPLGNGRTLNDDRGHLITQSLIPLERHETDANISKNLIAENWFVNQAYKRGLELSAQSYLQRGFRVAQVSEAYYEIGSMRPEYVVHHYLVVQAEAKVTKDNVRIVSVRINNPDRARNN